MARPTYEQLEESAKHGAERIAALTAETAALGGVISRQQAEIAALTGSDACYRRRIEGYQALIQQLMDESTKKAWVMGSDGYARCQLEIRRTKDGERLTVKTLNGSTTLFEKFIPNAFIHKGFPTPEEMAEAEKKRWAEERKAKQPDEKELTPYQIMLVSGEAYIVTRSGFHGDADVRITLAELARCLRIVEKQ